MIGSSAYNVAMFLKAGEAFTQYLDVINELLRQNRGVVVNGYGCFSLDVVDDTVKAVKLDDVEPTEENIKAGSYFLSRPFVMATKGEISEQNELVQALFDYVYSAEGDDLIKSVGLITTK